MSVQNTFTLNQRIARAGQLADLNPNLKLSYVATSDIPFGRIVVQEAGVDPANTARLPDAAGLHVLGVSILDLSRETATVGGDDSFYKIGDTVSVMRSGRIYVVAEAGCTVGDPVYFYRDVTVAIRGAFYNIANPSFDLLANATWDTNTAPLGIGIIRLN